MSRENVISFFKAVGPDSTESADEQLAAANGAGPLDFVHDLNRQGIVDWWLAQGR